MTIAAAVILATSMDVATYYLLPLVGSSEANPIVLALGPVAVVGKLLVGAAIAWAARRRLRYSHPVALTAVVVWGFGAWVNTL